MGAGGEQGRLGGGEVKEWREQEQKRAGRMEHEMKGEMRWRCKSGEERKVHRKGRSTARPGDV